MYERTDFSNERKKRLDGMTRTRNSEACYTAKALYILLFTTLYFILTALSIIFAVIADFIGLVDVKCRLDIVPLKALVHHEIYLKLRMNGLAILRLPVVRHHRASHDDDDDTPSATMTFG